MVTAMAMVSAMGPTRTRTDFPAVQAAANMDMAMARIIGWVGAAIVAILAGVFSFVIAKEGRSPATAHAIGFPSTGLVQANFAARTYGLRKARNVEARVNAAEQRLAFEGYRREPLSISALALIAEAMTEAADRRDRQKLLELAGQLTRRNAFVSNELMTSAAVRGDDKVFFRWLSRLILTNREMRESYVGAMAQATARPGAIAALAPIIGEAPSWTDFYWRKLVRQPESLVNGTRLRIAVAGAPWKQTEIGPSDRDLSLALVNRGEFDVASDLATALSAGSSPPRATANRLVNGDFARTPVLPPFDWDLTTAGNMGASIDPKARNLNISAIAGSRGPVARQLVRLTPGAYELRWLLSTDSPIEPDALSIGIRCAERGRDAGIALDISLNVGTQRRSIDIPESACRWFWYNVETRIDDGSPGVDVILEMLSLTPRAARAAQAN